MPWVWGVRHRLRCGAVGWPVFFGRSVTRGLVPEWGKVVGLVSLPIRCKARKPLSGPAISATTSAGAVYQGLFLLRVCSHTRPFLRGGRRRSGRCERACPVPQDPRLSPNSSRTGGSPFLPSWEAVPREVPVSAKMEAEGRRIPSLQGIAAPGALRRGRFPATACAHGGTA